MCRCPSSGHQYPPIFIGGLPIALIGSASRPSRPSVLTTKLGAASLAAAISTDPEAERNPASLTGGPGFLLQRTTAALTKNTLFGIDSSSLFERS
jgi:hypothetical protein